MSGAPLSGVVVADFSRVLAGPLATMVLADLGADVIKVERPGSGDDTRSWGPPFAGGDAAYYLSVNRNKRSVALDLGDSDDRALAVALVTRADVLVENFRPGVMERFGLGYEEVRDLNPQLVYASIPAFAHDSKQETAGYDILMQALAGYMSITGEVGGEPVKIGVALLDVLAGLHAAVGILAALRSRDDDGTGRHITVGLFEASVAGLVNQAASYLVGGIVPVAAGSAHPSIVPYQSFAGLDEHFVLAAGNDKLYQATCVVVGRPDLAADPRFRSNAGRVTHRAELVPQLEAEFARRPAAEWIAELEASGVPAAPVRSLDGVFASPEGRSMVAEVADPLRGLLRMVRSPLGGIGLDPADYRPPPSLGQDDAEVRAYLAESPNSPSP